MGDTKYAVEETTGYKQHYYGSMSNMGTISGHPGPWRDFGHDERAADEYSKQVKNQKK